MVYIALTAVLLVTGLLIYMKFNRGIPRKAVGQQSRRMVITVVVAVIPAAAALLPLGNAPVALALTVALAWMITYPLHFHITNRKMSPDYENYMDIIFGIYSFGMISGLLALKNFFFPDSIVAGVIIALAEAALLIIPVTEWIYFMMYKGCIDANGMKLIQDTNTNEIIEFVHSFPLRKTILTALAIVALIALLIIGNMPPVTVAGDNILIRSAIVAAATIFMVIYVWKQHHGVFVRTGFKTLYDTIKEYSQKNALYTKHTEERMADLEVEALGERYARPSTIVMVIGESASRDYMSCFREQDRETTPWMSEMKKDSRHWMLYPHAYSCAMHTVQSLEKSLTEYNQYNGKEFFSSCSVVDIAHKMGYRVHWYSNQGHLGTNDTPVTLVADTAEVAKWTKQEVNKVMYDESLLDFLDELDPTTNNFLVIHLKGSHFNYLNRYPETYTQWGEPGVEDNVLNYKNSIHYTDYILSRIYDYAKEKLNLQAMVYFSDHASDSNLRRSPRFNGFKMVRIPLAVYTSDEFISKHKERYEALTSNKDKYFTNDLIYELMCGIFDIRSNHFDERGSLAYPDYQYTKDNLLTNEGQQKISDDKEE